MKQSLFVYCLIFSILLILSPGASDKGFIYCEDCIGNSFSSPEFADQNLDNNSNIIWISGYNNAIENPNIHNVSQGDNSNAIYIKGEGVVEGGNYYDIKQGNNSNIIKNIVDADKPTAYNITNYGIAQVNTQNSSIDRSNAINSKTENRSNTKIDKSINNSIITAPAPIKNQTAPFFDVIPLLYTIIIAVCIGVIYPIAIRYIRTIRNKDNLERTNDQLTYITMVLGIIVAELLNLIITSSVSFIQSVSEAVILLIAACIGFYLFLYSDLGWSRVLKIIKLNKKPNETKQERPEDRT